MADVTLSSAVRTNLLSLQNTSTLLEETQTRLATGLRVNSALDDPSAFFTSSSLNSRAGDLNRLLDSVGLAIQTVEAADDGIQAITDLVEAAQASARNALQAASAVTTAATTTGTIGISISDQSATTTTTAGLTADTPATTGNGGVAINGQTDFVTNTALAEDDTFSINGTVITIGTSGGAEVNNTTDLLAYINTNVANVTASLNGSNQLLLTADNADTDIAITGGNAAVTSVLGLTASTSDAQSTNLLDQGFAQGETFVVQVGANAATTITFGTGGSEVSTIAELQTALTTGTVAGTSAVTVGATGDITLTATNNTDSISISGNTAGLFGFASNVVTVNPAAASLINNGIVAQNDTFSVVVGATTTTITFGTGGSEVDTFAELDAALEGITGITSSVDANGFLTIAASDTTTSFTLTDGTNTPLASAFGITPGAFAPTTTNNVTRAAAEAEFNNLLTQIDQLAVDASFNGNNLLDGDNLSVIFNEDGSSSLAITGVTFNSAGLGISAAATDSFQTDSNINSTLTELDTAITSLRTQAATFGSNLSVVQIRQDFTKNLINTLETGAANLTLADSNEEAANLLALQTRQSLSSSSLSLAARADQNVLQLLR